MELKYRIREKNRTPIWEWQKTPEIVMKSWQSELVSSEFYQQQTESSVFLTEPILGHRNNLHGIYVENEKEFSHD